MSRHHAERQQRIEQSDDGSLMPRALAELFEKARDCPYCGCRLTPITAVLDHIIPLAREGKHSILNAVVCCGSCNMRKGTKLPLEFIWLHAV